MKLIVFHKLLHKIRSTGEGTCVLIPSIVGSLSVLQTQCSNVIHALFTANAMLYPHLAFR